jgi:hypothetical protein
METLPERLDWLWFLDFNIETSIPDHSVQTAYPPGCPYRRVRGRQIAKGKTRSSYPPTSHGEVLRPGRLLRDEEGAMAAALESADTGVPDRECAEHPHSHEGNEEKVHGRGEEDEG